MIAHIVLFRPRPELDLQARRGLTQAFSDVLREVASIRQARIGRRTTHGRPYEQLMRENYTHAAILEFDDLAGLQLYLEHPAHETLAARFFACFEQALMYDFELNDGARALESLAQADDV